ncbi:uncharacterized protein TrAtP1_003286 [Trichoderma atroviride]|uniref:uncharacterized protein n=1 Tax=Hypocrea atroviridis TaxID=63577 RepID=UPI003330BA51|nr:hypothetical protein TrAtP1_003286 [Trichoderma atroviride]
MQHPRIFASSGFTLFHRPTIPPKRTTCIFKTHDIEPSAPWLSSNPPGPSVTMRTSRISKDTAKLARRAADSASPPRRTTRSSLARFAHNAGVKTEQTPDIEDSITDPPTKRRRGSDASFSAELAKDETDSDEDDKLNALLAAPAIPPKSARRARKPARKVSDPDTGESTVSPPSDWEEMYNVVRKMRAPGGAAYGAAVDTMGCERLADRSASPRDQRLHSLIALMLSSQTKDTVTAVVMRRLQTELPAYKPGAPVGLNLDNVLAVDENLLNQMIWAVGFHNNKTKFVLRRCLFFYCGPCAWFYTALY